MNPDAASHPNRQLEVGVFECEIHLKFRLIEENCVLNDREKLLELLIDAFTAGADEYLEPLHSCVKTKEISELEASSHMRRQLMRLRNSSNLT
ncbi:MULTISPECIES: Npun_R1517 family heterocyst differentiation transcriptional regulator [Chroococcidiopsis]|jgi:uncharacterized protein HemY|uniref:Npun R1517 domain-containing protein n=1 Tax=Chroococcidiopsis thermalis (strain PCC 7203) TaxID=251229 RepID=K9U500_CHRTP|nr:MULTISPECIES: Npun_R1517 family heterocyst differentiation transcriptional regulator [Chroococcidiopsis]MBE9015697.1 Npun_R1517 family heterocyst differentiation transcriptional regulator [Chroococcidiopsidales cyanobacterium LEGE 13417]PSB43285.1 hypothetical protein C7B80_24620 [Cyanosarcina cf. burmensis CCALA 770]AFY89895.1 hypothetical protein Chro_4503 [Chroococcidiopsis thermalis PCC 7203]PSM47151.1 hypothetical protein C7Y66_21180 [Chroococcidiopsis sp. CCALA 051]URD49287.1 Npun_R15